MRALSDDEGTLLTHVRMFGSDGYPIHKFRSGGWHWSFLGLRAPVVYKTRCEATAALETYLGVLRALKAGREPFGAVDREVNGS